LTLPAKQECHAGDRQHHADNGESVAEAHDEGLPLHDLADDVRLGPGTPTDLANAAVYLFDRSESVRHRRSFEGSPSPSKQSVVDFEMVHVTILRVLFSRNRIRTCDPLIKRRQH